MGSCKELQRIDKLGADYLGLIFYPKSPRNFSDASYAANTSASKVGVFVNESQDVIQEKVERFALDVIQLHGDESPEFCKSFQKNIKVWKAISIADESSFQSCEGYHGLVDAFVFDTKAKVRGGSGQKFDWSVLEHYQGETPFLLSGGISEEDAEAILKINHTKLIGLDINSKFEDAPGIKNEEKIKSFKKNYYGTSHS